MVPAIVGLEVRMASMDMTPIWTGPIPFLNRPGGEEIGQILAIRFDGEYTIGTIKLCRAMSPADLRVEQDNATAPPL